MDELRVKIVTELTNLLTLKGDDDHLGNRIESSIICESLLSKFTIDAGMRQARADGLEYITKTISYVINPGYYDDLIIDLILLQDKPAKYNTQQHEKTAEENTEISNFETKTKEAVKNFLIKCIKSIVSKSQDYNAVKFTNKYTETEQSYLSMAKTILANMILNVIMAVDKNSQESERLKCSNLLKELNIQTLNNEPNLLHSRINSNDIELLNNQVIKILKMTKTAGPTNRCMATSTVESSLTKINSSTIAKMLNSDHLKETETDQRKKAQLKMNIKKFISLLDTLKIICTKYVSNGNFDRQMKLDFETVKCCFEDLMTITDGRATYKDLQVDLELGCITKLINSVKETIIEVSKGTSFTLNEQIHKLSIQQSQNAEKAKGLTRKPLPILSNIDISRYAKERYNLPVRRRKGFEAEPYAPPFYLQEQQTWMKFAMTSLEAYNLESGLESYNDWLLGSFRTLKLERHKRIWWNLFIFNEQQGQIDYTNLIKSREEYLKTLTIIGAKIDPTGIESVNPIGCLYEYNHSPNQQPGELGSDLLERLIESLSKANSSWYKNIADKKMLILMFNKRVTDVKLLQELSSVRYSSLKGTMNSGDYELLRTLLIDYENAEMERNRSLTRESNTNTRLTKSANYNIKKIRSFLQKHYCNLHNRDAIIQKACSKILDANSYEEAQIAYSDEITRISSERETNENVESSQHNGGESGSWQECNYYYESEDDDDDGNEENSNDEGEGSESDDEYTSNGSDDEEYASDDSEDDEYGDPVDNHNYEENEIPADECDEEYTSNNGSDDEEYASDDYEDDEYGDPVNDHNYEGNEMSADECDD